MRKWFFLNEGFDVTAVTIVCFFLGGGGVVTACCSQIGVTDIIQGCDCMQ